MVWCVRGDVLLLQGGQGVRKNHERRGEMRGFLQKVKMLGGGAFRRVTPDAEGFRQKATKLLIVSICFLMCCSASLTFSADNISSNDKGKTENAILVGNIALLLLSGNRSMEGTFIDSAVDGLHYKTSSGLSGKTNSQGTFQYRRGDTVEFFAGGISIGSLTAGELVSVLNLQYFSQAAMLLQALDEDRNPSTGIKISLDSDSKLINSPFAISEVDPNDSSFVQKYEQVTGRKFTINEENSVRHSVSSVAIEMLKRSDWNFAYKYYTGDIVYPSASEELKEKAHKRMSLYFWWYLVRPTLELTQKEIWASSISDLKTNATFKHQTEWAARGVSAMYIVAGNPNSVVDGMVDGAVDASIDAVAESLSLIPGDGAVAVAAKAFAEREAKLLIKCGWAYKDTSKIVDCALESILQISDIYNNTRTSISLAQNTIERNSYTLAMRWLEEWYLAGCDAEYLKNKFGFSMYNNEEALNQLAAQFLYQGAEYDVTLTQSIINNAVSSVTNLGRLFFNSTQLPRDIPEVGDVLKFDVQDPIVNGNDLVFCYQLSNQVNGNVSGSANFWVTPNGTGYTPASINEPYSFTLGPLDVTTNCATLTVGELAQGVIKEDFINLKLHVSYENNGVTEIVTKDSVYHLSTDIMKFLRNSADLLVNTVSPVMTNPGVYCLLQLEHELPLYGSVSYAWRQVAAEQSGVSVSIIDADKAEANFLVPELPTGSTEASLWFAVTVTSLESGESVNKVVKAVVKAIPDTTPGCSTGPKTVMWGGKEWQRCDDGQQRNWADAMSYCENLVLDGHSDWRLPNVDELKGLRVCTNGFFSGINSCNPGSQSPTIDPSFQCVASNYWSSTTTSTNYSGYAWNVHFGSGYAYDNYYKPIPSYVRCVRSGQ